jgi:hypothetical protein
MTQVFRGHFDGNVLVPEQPVDLPIGRSMEFRVDDTAPLPSANVTAAALLAAVRSGPRVTREDAAEFERAITQDRSSYSPQCAQCGPYKTSP